MCDHHDDRIDRRTVLKSAGIGVVGVGGFPASASASKDQDAHCQGCLNAEVLAEDSTYHVSTVETEGHTYVFWTHKDTGAVFYRDITEEGDTLTDNELGIQDGISPTNHEDVFEQTEYWEHYHGSCGGYVYNDHYSAGMSAVTGESLDDLPSDLLAGALCAAIGAKAGGPVGAAIGALVCGAVGYLFLDHIDLSGNDLTIGAWDCHGGSLNVESVCTGGTLSYTDDPSDLIQFRRISGPHMEIGDAITDYL